MLSLILALTLVGLDHDLVEPGLVSSTYCGSVDVSVLQVEVVGLDKSQFANHFIKQRLTAALRLHTYVTACIYFNDGIDQALVTSTRRN